MPRSLRYFLALVVASVPLSWCLCLLLLDRYGLRRRVSRNADAIIVPGCRVLEGGVPSAHLQRRVEKAVELWRNGTAPTIVLTGGVGKHPPSEAEVAAHFAKTLGAPSSALVLEDGSASTEENAWLATRAIGARRAVVVTDSYHVFRTARVFARYFDEVDVVGVRPPWRFRIENGLREVAAIGLYWIKGRL